MEIFRFSADLGRDLNHATLNALTDLEVEAAANARLTPGAADLIRRSREENKSVAAASNNSVAAITAFLEAHGLLTAVDLISARMDPDPGLMKPSPYLVRQALDQLGADAALSLLIGDSVTDMQASKSAGITTVGYANKLGKADRLVLRPSMEGANARPKD